MKLYFLIPLFLIEAYSLSEIRRIHPVEGIDSVSVIQIDGLVILDSEIHLKVNNLIDTFSCPAFVYKGTDVHLFDIDYQDTVLIYTSFYMPLGGPCEIAGVLPMSHFYFDTDTIIVYPKANFDFVDSNKTKMYSSIFDINGIPKENSYGEKSDFLKALEYCKKVCTKEDKLILDIFDNILIKNGDKYDIQLYKDKYHPIIGYILLKFRFSQLLEYYESKPQLTPMDIVQFRKIENLITDSRLMMKWKQLLGVFIDKLDSNKYQKNIFKLKSRFNKISP